jgi:hypothetical protein
VRLTGLKNRCRSPQKTRTAPRNIARTLRPFSAPQGRPNPSRAGESQSSRRCKLAKRLFGLALSALAVVAAVHPEVMPGCMQPE